MASKKIELIINDKKTGSGLKQTSKELDQLGNSSKKASKDVDSYTNSSKRATKANDDHKRSTVGLSKQQQTLSGRLRTAGSSLGMFGGQVGGAAGKIGAASGAVGVLGDMLGGPLVAVAVAAGAALVAFGASSYEAAKKSQAEWAKFKGVAESAGLSFDATKAQVVSFANEAGISVGEARGAMQQLIQTGNNTPEGLRAVHEMAIGLKTDMGAAATAYSRIVAGGAGGARTLKKLGITMEEISTGGKIDTAKLNEVLEKKFGKAADNFANSAEAASARMDNAWSKLQVAFGNTLLGPMTGLQNGIAWVLNGLTAFGGLVFNLFGGANAFSGAMDYITPALNELWSAISDLFPEVSGTGSQFGMLKPILTFLGMVIANAIRPITILVQSINLVIMYGRRLGAALGQAGAFIQSLPGRIWGGITGGLASLGAGLRGAGGAILNAASNFGSWLWSIISNAIPRLQWPSVGSIYSAIVAGLGFGGPPSGLFAGNLFNYKSQKAKEKLAAAAAAARAQGGTSPVPGGSNYSQTINDARAAMGIFGGPGNGINFDALNPRYQGYLGSRQDPWTGAGTLLGNCVDMTRGLLQYAAANGAKRLAVGFSNWDGQPHVYPIIDGQDRDPAAKALKGTWQHQGSKFGGPGDGLNTVVINGDVYGFDDFQKKCELALGKSLSRVM